MVGTTASSAYWWRHLVSSLWFWCVVLNSHKHDECFSMMDGMRCVSTDHLTVFIVQEQKNNIVLYLVCATETCVIRTIRMFFGLIANDRHHLTAMQRLFTAALDNTQTRQRRWKSVQPLFVFLQFYCSNFKFYTPSYALLALTRWENSNFSIYNDSLNFSVFLTDIGPVTVTTDADEFENQLSNLYVQVCVANCCCSVNCGALL